jgi:hypothetical protein
MGQATDRAAMIGLAGMLIKVENFMPAVYGLPEQL